jgi:hypothetical protein
MKRSSLIFSVALAFLATSEYAMAQVGAPTTMKFTSIPIAEKLGEASHKVLPYRSEDRVVVIVVDPIMCGQRPTNPTFAIKDGKISLHYDLTAAPVGSTLPNCAAHSTFDLDSVPHGDFIVEFSGGKELPHTAQMTRCPKTQPKFDIWDCMVPVK